MCLRLICHIMAAMGDVLRFKWRIYVAFENAQGAELLTYTTYHGYTTQ
jgi:hypothetical protein